jgi:hypothetical protein
MGRDCVDKLFDPPGGIWNLRQVSRSELRKIRTCQPSVEQLAWINVNAS